MSITSTNFTDLSYMKEVTPGVTPDTPSFQLLPTTGGGPTGGLTTAVSEEIRSDRQTDDLVVVDAEIGGSSNYELTYVPYKPLIISLLQDSVQSASTSASDISTTTSAFLTAAGDFVADGYAVGGYIQVSGFTDPANNGIFLINAVAIGQIDVSAVLIAEAAGNAIVISSEFIRNGAKTQPDSYTFLKRITGIDAPAYFYYRGMQISQMTFNFATGSILDGTFDLMGFTEEVTETAVTGQTFVDIPEHALMNSVSSITSIDIVGLSVDSEFESLTLTVNNNINAAKAIGTLGAVDLASFTLDITGDINLYFEDIATYEKFKAADSFSVAITLEDSSGNIMIVSLPKVKFETLDSPIDGKDNFLFQSGTMRALRDATNNYMIQFDFFDAP